MTAPNGSYPDIVERLRKKQAFVRTGYAYDATLEIDPDCIEAANEIERLRGVAQEAPRRGDLTKLAAECHRAKWAFDLSEDYQPSRAAACALILKAFAELHRIGDMALKLRDGSVVSSTDSGGAA